MSILYENIKEACNRKGVTPSAMCLDLGMSKSIISDLKSERKKSLSTETLYKIATYLGVTSDSLFNGDFDNKTTPTLTKKDERDIAREMESFMKDMGQGGTLMFDGNPLSDEAKESIMAAMKLGLEAAKLKNKEKYTPKKYRKE